MNGREKPENEFTNDLGIIDPRSDALLNDPRLSLLLNFENVGKFFPAGTNYFVVENKTYAFTSHYALSITTDDYENLTADVVDTDSEARIGAGSVADVFPVIGNIKYRYVDNTEGFIFKAGEDKSVAKVGIDKFNQENAYVQRVVTEYDRATKAVKLRVRPPTFGETENKVLISSLPQRHVKGISLLEYLKTENQHLLSIADCYELSIALYKQLAKQMHEQGLIHCDIKPENILVYKNHTGWHVTIIDVNLAQIKEEQHTTTIGSYAYLAKESFDGKYNEYTDIFAMSLVAGLLWGDKNQRSMHNIEDKEAVYELRDKDNWRISFDFITGIDELPNNCKDAITNFLSMATDVNPDKRPALMECFAFFEMQYFNYKRLSHIIPEINIKDAESGMLSGIKVCGLFGEYSNESVSFASTQKLKNQLLSEIAKLPDNVYAVREFGFASGINAFKDIHTKDGLRTATNLVIDNFFTEYSQSKSLSDSLEPIQLALATDPSLEAKSVELNKYRQDLNLFHEKILRTGIDLNDIADATSHLQRKYLKVLAAKRHFSQLVKEKKADSQTSPGRMKK